MIFMFTQKWFLYRTIDSLAVGYGKGKLTCFLGDPEAIIDLVSSNDLLIIAEHSTTNNVEL